LEEFGASGLAWGRIVEGIIVEELWKHLVNAAPVTPDDLIGRWRKYTKRVEDGSCHRGSRNLRERLIYGLEMPLGYGSAGGLIFLPKSSAG
jgi:hypothetical protein